MPDVALNDIIRVTWFGQCFGQRIMMQHDYRVDGVVGANDIISVQDALITELAASGNDGLETDYTACLATAYTGDFVRAQRVYPVRMRASSGTMTTSGSAGTTELSNIAAAVNFITDFSGRSQQAVKHLGPISSETTLVDNGVLTTAYNTLLNTFANSLLDNVSLLTGNVDLTPVVVHIGDPVWSSTDLTNFNLGSAARVMRRRTVGLGI